MVVLLIFIDLPANLGTQLRNWRVGIFNCVYLKTIILEMQNSKKIR